MKKIKLPSLKINEGKFSGGFTTLSDSQIEKVKGGKKGVRDDNAECHNVRACSGTNTGCTNDVQCY